MRAVKRGTLGSATLASSLTGAVVLASSGMIAGAAFDRAGAALLLGAPFLSGFAAAFIRNEWSGARLRDGLVVALISLLLVSAGSVLVAWDSVLCVLMALPPAAVLAVLGALMGHSAAHGRPSMSPVIALLMCWPLLAAADARHAPDQHEVRTIIEVAGSLERLPAAPSGSETWQLIAGISHPGAEREFVVHELAEGRTRIEARTSYSLEIYPARYWSLWSDAILRRMQLRMLDQIKRNAEAEHTSG
jgi:hypothetical protein